MLFKTEPSAPTTCLSSKALTRKVSIFALIVSLLQFGLHVKAQPVGDCIFDSTFGEGGHVSTDFSGGFGIANVVALQPDGKIVVGGEGSDAARGVAGFALVRYNRDGSLDYSFGRGGKSVINTGGVPGSEVTALALQRDGKIVVIGIISHGISHTFDIILARYNSDGQLDRGFGHGGKIVNPGSGFYPARTLALQRDGKIVLGGAIYQDDAGNFALLRYNPDGSPDDGTIKDSTPGDSFGDRGQVVTRFSDLGSGVAALTLQRDGKIVAAGYSRSVNYSQSDFALARYNRDGQLDTTFDGDGMLTTSLGAISQARDVVIQPDGKIVAAGFRQVHFSYFSGTTDFALVRYNPDGSLDTTFDNDGTVATMTSGGYIRAIALARDGKIVAAGYASHHDAALVRYNPDGSLDTTFGRGGKFFSSTPEAKDVVVQPDGRIVFTGTDVNFHFGVARLLGDIASGIDSLTLYSSTAPSCHVVQGVVRLCPPAPPGGLTVALTSTNPAANVPPRITIPEGQDEARFEVRTASASGVTSGYIIARTGQLTKQVSLTVQPVGVAILSLATNTVVGSHSVTGIVTLKCPAPAEGVTVTLSSSNPAAAYPTTSQLTIAPGSKRRSFTIRTNDLPSARQAIIKATANRISKSQVLTVQ